MKSIGERTWTTLPAPAPSSSRSGATLRASVRTRASVPWSRWRWRGPEPRRTRAPSAATTSRPTRSPVRMWCSASAAAARTVRSSVLAAPSIPPETPMSRSPSTTSHTPASCSARVVMTCSSPVRSDTGQVIRLSRSPVAKCRIPSNSVPEPSRRDRCRPTRPSGCGTSARLSYGAVCGSTVSPLLGQVDGPPAPPGPRTGQGDPLGAHAAAAPAARAEVDGRQAVGDQRPRGAVGRRGDDVRRPRRDPGDVLDAGRVVDLEPRRGALALVEAAVVEAGVDPATSCRGCAARPIAARTTNGAASTTSTS